MGLHGEGHSRKGDQQQRGQEGRANLLCQPTCGHPPPHEVGPCHERTERQRPQRPPRQHIGGEVDAQSQTRHADQCCEEQRHRPGPATTNLCGDDAPDPDRVLRVGRRESERCLSRQRSHLIAVPEGARPDEGELADGVKRRAQKQNQAQTHPQARAHTPEDQRHEQQKEDLIAQHA